VVKLEEYKPEHLPGVRLLLKAAFGSEHELTAGEELVLRLIVPHPQQDGCVIAHSAVYIRKMSSAAGEFSAGIIGDVAVDPAFQRRGLMRDMFDTIHSHFLQRGVSHSFLFAYHPATYASLGYKPLQLPINYWDVLDKRWNTYLYHGAMIRSVGDELPDGVIEFNGRTY